MYAGSPSQAPPPTVPKVDAEESGWKQRDDYTTFQHFVSLPALCAVQTFGHILLSQKWFLCTL